MARPDIAGNADGMLWARLRPLDGSSTPLVEQRDDRHGFYRGQDSELAHRMKRREECFDQAEMSVTGSQCCEANALAV